MPVKKKTQKKPARKTKQLSYSETKSLCREYFEHEKKLKECGKMHGNGIHSWHFRLFIYGSEQSTQEKSNDICIEALENRMDEIKAKVGESAIEMHREMKELKDRVSKLESGDKSSCDTGRVVSIWKTDQKPTTFTERLKDFISRNTEKCCVCGDDC